ASGAWIVEIAGNPAGFLCPKHKKEWERLWDGALTPQLPELVNA
ncbi:MAG: hypothetical protein QOJ29_3448, partial [Thermoleophilaceae bacterium]|nr:hypothetical protein [Thermoleophilaceae bacterium]